MTYKPPILATVMLLIALIIDTAVATAYGNLSLIDDDALFIQQDEVYDPGFGPRYFVNGMPPVPTLWPLAKAKRQTPGQCESGYHACLEVGPSGAESCCRNDQYCFLDAAWDVKCCGLGTTCNSTCPENLLYCNDTVTTSTTLNTQGTTTILQETSQTSGCCGRRCSSSSFLCQQDFGGQCCEYGANCISGGSCSFPPSSVMSTLVTPVPPGCTTSQITCATGGGCCNIGSICTSSVQATTTAQLCAVNLTVVDTGGLSEGARVGIGVGVAVGAAVVIGALTWFWISRRRKAKSAREGGTFDESGDRETENREPFMPYGGASSDMTSPTSGLGMRPRLHETGLVYDYYGPDAVPGPYTDSSTIAATEPRSSPNLNDRVAMAVNRYPHGPADVVGLVEMDAEARAAAARAELGDEGTVAAKKEATTNDQPAMGPFELVGSLGPSPPPMNFEEAEQERARAFSPSPPVPPEGNEQEAKEAKK